MQEIEKTPTERESSAVANHTEKIKSQVLAKIGLPPQLDHVEVCHHHHGNYRVNIWERPKPDNNIAITIAPRIGRSYYLKVSESGEIIESDPAMIKLFSRA